MRAWVREGYGLDALALRDVPDPPLDPDAVLVRVRATSVNAAEWYGSNGGGLVIRAATGWRAPRKPLFGVDFAGVVEAVGERFDGDLAPGDEVLGGRDGAYAELVCVKNGVVRKPPGVTFEEAGGVAIAGTTALQAVRDHAGVRAGQRVLLNGASGGVGTFALQILKAYGAEVTAVCSTGKVEQARQLGADRVLDYTREDFTRTGERYDAVVDVGGGRSFREVARVLAPEAPVVVAGVGNVKPGFVGPIGQLVRMKGGGLAARRRCVFFVAKINRADMQELADLMADGRVRTVVEDTFPFERLPDALRRLGRGGAAGKLVVRL
ncbi:MAG TPA: NAD(P)-dependent alcohol dehydrogenase [Gaiellaceae bacterium]|nr:NAD(P)-dependent alcohol dehydrogenase [Gaiellaceae bacterium]